MEVQECHARTRPITRCTVLPGNRPDQELLDASREVVRVVSDVSVSCPATVYRMGNRGGGQAFALTPGSRNETVTAERRHLTRGLTDVVGSQIEDDEWDLAPVKHQVKYQKQTTALAGRKLP